jgi:MinD-like ATPase involved in chromosome partitioning or flagellar assembly
VAHLAPLDRYRPGRKTIAKTISIHSIRGGTGKSNIIANVAALRAAEGRRVGVIDTDIQSPGIHGLFGMDEGEMHHALNDYLWGKCDIKRAAYDVMSHLGLAIQGRLFLIPSSIRAGEIARVLREGYDVGLLNDGLHNLVEDLTLELLMIDSHPGLHEETLLSIAIPDGLTVILRLDQQDYQGTGATMEVARKLGVPRTLLAVNKVPAGFDPAEVKARVERTYECEVSAVLPHSDALMPLASAGIFALRYPHHPVTALLQQVAATLVA